MEASGKQFKDFLKVKIEQSAKTTYGKRELLLFIEKVSLNFWNSC